MKSKLTNRKRKNHFELHPHNQYINKKRIKSYRAVSAKFMKLIYSRDLP